MPFLTIKTKMEHQNIIFFLGLIDRYKKKDIPLDIFKPEHKDYLILHEYIELGEDGYFLTKKGRKYLNKNENVQIKIQYPLMKKGKVGSYNNVINTMSPDAANALSCAMIKNDFFKKVSVSNTRVIIQHLIDTKNFHKWGEELIRKLNVSLNESIVFFDKKREETTTCITPV